MCFLVRSCCCLLFALAVLVFEFVLLLRQGFWRILLSIVFCILFLIGCKYARFSAYPL